MPKSIIYMVILLTVFAFMIGCSSSPVIPDSSQSDIQQSMGWPTSNPCEILWGLFDIAIDPATESAEIIPLRGAMFEVNVNKFLQPPCVPTDMLKISVLPETEFPLGYVVVDVGIQHPFPSTNLRGFDVMGIFMPPEGENTSLLDPAITWPSHNQARLLNADGYTRWWNQVEFTSYETIFGYTEGSKSPHNFSSTNILNPFKYYADGLEPDDPFDLDHLNNTDRGSFATTAPGFLERRYEIQFPLNSPADFRFKYAISASWSPPYLGTIPPASIDDFPVTANRPEPTLVGITNTGSTAFWSSPTHYGGDLSFEIAITDWQGGGTITGTIGEFTGVYAESPTLFDGTIDLMETGEWLGEPYDATFFIWCYLPDVNPTTVANQELLITVISSFPTSYIPQHPAGAGFDYPEGVALAAYNVWEVPIKDE